MVSVLGHSALAAGMFCDNVIEFTNVIVTTTGKQAGGQVSCDALRKHVTSISCHSTATHSPRKDEPCFTLGVASTKMRHSSNGDGV